MNHHTLKATLACLCLALPASTPAWSGEPHTTLPARIPGHYTISPWYGRTAPGPARPGPITGHRYYPAPWYGPARGSQLPAPATRPPRPAVTSTQPARTGLQAELATRSGDLATAREELSQNMALLEDAGRSLDHIHDQYNRLSAAYAALDTELATARAEHDLTRERETELSIELMAAEKRLAQLSQQLEQLQRRDANCSARRDEQERLLTDCAAQRAELEVLVQTGRDDTNDLRNKLAALEQQLDLKTAEAQAGNTGARELRSELAALEQQLALAKVEVQAAAEALTRAQTESSAARAQHDAQSAQAQACQNDRDRLATALEQERGARESMQRSQAETQAAARAAEGELSSCNAALATAQEQIEALVAKPAAGPATAPAAPPDGDGDGVADPDDRCPDSLPGAEVGADGCAGNTPLILEGVSFRYDSHELAPGSHAVLDRVAASLRRQPALRLEIAGHTDAQGNPAYNQWLSQQRATRVMDYLVSKGVKPERLTARGYGEQEPIADNSTREGLARNRRVELRRLP